MDRTTTQDRSRLLDPHARVHAVEVPQVIFPAYQHLPFKLCEEAGLFTWVEVHIPPGRELSDNRFSVTTSSDSEGWARRHSVSEPYATDSERIVYRAPILPRLDTLWTLKEDLRANLCVEIHEGDKPIFRRDTFQLTVQRMERAVIRRAVAGESGHDVFGLFPVFVTPGDPAVTRFFSQVGGVGGRRTAGAVAGRPRVDAGNTCQADRDARDIYNILKSNNCIFITGEMPRREFCFETQLAKFPAQTLMDKSGNCIDYAVLFASLMEHIGNFPRIVVLLDHNHAVAGWRRGPDGSQISLLDVSAAAKGLSFSAARQVADELYEATPPERRVVVDIRKRRERRPPVRPFSHAVPTRDISWVRPASVDSTTSETEPTLPAPPPEQRPGPARPKRRRFRWIGFASALLAAAAAAAYFWSSLGWVTPAPPPVDWPPRPKVLVAPLGCVPDRTVDRILWPLADRMIFNSLEAYERVFGLLERVDPRLVERELAVRDLKPPLTPGEADELALALGADVVAHGSVTREAGLIRIHGVLRRALSQEGRDFDVGAVNLVDAAYSVGNRIAQILPFPPRLHVPDARLRPLLLARSHAALFLAEASPRKNSSQRRELYKFIQVLDPKAVGPAWFSFLEDVRDSSSAAELKARARTVTDPELREFLEEVSETSIRGDACIDLDLAVLAKDYPLSLGQLAPALCYYRRGQMAEALKHALIAAESPQLRLFATRVAVHLLHYSLSGSEALKVRRDLQSLIPESAVGWSALGNWYAMDGQVERALTMLKVGRALRGDDDPGEYYAQLHAAHICLLGLDVQGAGERIARLERDFRTVAAGADANYVMLKALTLSMRGQFREADRLVEKTLTRFEKEPGDEYTMLAISAFYSALHWHRLEDARRISARFEELFDNPENIGDRYWALSLHLALQERQGRMSHEQAWKEMGLLGDAVVAVMGDSGRTEREAQEGLYLSHLGSQESCKDLVFRAMKGNKFLGGCRFRYAQLLAENGEHAEAAAQFQQALNEMVWIKFLYSEFIPAALLGRASALEKLGKEREARQLYELITRNYGSADVDVAELKSARAALARLK